MVALDEYGRPYEMKDITLPSRCRRVSKMKALYCCCYRRGQIPILSVGPEICSLVGVSMFAIFAGAWFFSVGFQLHSKDKHGK